MRLDCTLQVRLEDRRGHIRSRSLDHGPEGIRRSPQTARDGVGVLDSHEKVEHLLHRLEKLHSPADITGTETIKQIASELGGRLGQSVQPSRESNLKLLV